MRNEQEPIVTQRESRSGDTGSTVRHPCFGMIGASRRSGHAVLFGSDFIHNNSVAIRIYTADLDRDLSHDWPHARQELIEVVLSEAQWATFVSSMNVGDGVQCTLRTKDGVNYPELPEPIQRDKQFMDEAKASIQRSLTELDKLYGMVRELKTSEKSKKEILDQIRMARMQVSENAPFVVESFDKHMEKIVEKAKIEVNAYATKQLIETGIAALNAPRQSPVIMLSDRSHENQEETQ